MAEAKNRWAEIQDRLKNTYRLVVMNDDTFEEIGSYRLTQMNIYVLLSSLFVLISIFVVSLIIFTPLKQYIPGYGDINVQERVYALVDRVEEVEEEVQARDVYIENIQKMLTGNVEYVVEAPEEVEIEVDTLEAVDPIPEEYQIREDVEREEQMTDDMVINSKFISQPTSQEMFFGKPINGASISDRFNPQKDHYGIDLIAPTNTPILSVMEGVVIMSDYTYETGYVIGIQHENNFISFYKHNDKLLKKLGEQVKVGDAIAVIGNTGAFSFGPHLHFELWHQNKPVNPIEYINF